MPRKSSTRFLIKPDDTVEIVEQKLRDRFGDKLNQNFSVSASTSDKSDSRSRPVGRPYADWQYDAYIQYCAIRATGKPEKLAAGEIASVLRKSESAVVKAMRAYDDAQTDDFWTAMMQNDVKKAAVAFCSLDAHIRIRIAKQIRRYRK